MRQCGGCSAMVLLCALGLPLIYAADATVERGAVAPASDPLTGIWWRYERGVEGSPVRFYYFHGDGKGLYRYGRVGHTNTNSFDYTIEGDELQLVFRKTGERHRVPFSVEREGDRHWLELREDPREGGKTRYFRDRDPQVPHAAHGDGPLPAGRMWIDYSEFATGGVGFALYQFRPGGIDGRGVGWFHRGDFDDWSTESLTYRITDETLELEFSLTGERHATRFVVEGAADKRTLSLESDPRDFWHAHRFRDAGRSFGSEPQGLADVVMTVEW